VLSGRGAGATGVAIEQETKALQVRVIPDDQVEFQWEGLPIANVEIRDILCAGRDSNGVRNHSLPDCPLIVLTNLSLRAAGTFSCGFFYSSKLLKRAMLQRLSWVILRG